MPHGRQAGKAPEQALREFERQMEERRRQESGEAKAERLVREEVAKLGGAEEELVRRRKGDAARVRIVRRLRAETTMTLAWIAQRLRMGVWTHVSNLPRAEGG